MHIGTQLYLAVVLLIQAVCAANIIPENERCVTAVYTALAYVSFTGEPAVGAWDIRCRNPLMVTSIYAAAEEYCGKYEQTAGFVQLNSYCENVAHTELLPRENVAENLTDESVRKMRVVEFHKLSRANKINYPVRISPAYYGRTFNTIVRNYYCGRRRTDNTLTAFLGYMAARSMGPSCLRVSLFIPEYKIIETNYRLCPVTWAISTGAVYF